MDTTRAFSSQEISGPLERGDADFRNIALSLTKIEICNLLILLEIKVNFNLIETDLFISIYR